jgi:hypothetical protein
MTADRKRTLAAGVFYLVTFVAIPALILIGPVLDDPNYIVSDGVDTRVLLGCVLDIVVALTCIGTAVALFPVLRRHNEASALGFVTTRMFEAGVILIGVASLIALVSLRQSIGGPDAADPAALVVAGQSLVAVRDVTFLLGPGVVPALNALLLAPILYRNRLVPRIVPIIGLIGVPLLLASSAATLFGANAQISGLSFLLGLPIACWELSLGIWMIIKGFNSAFPVGYERSAGAPTGATHPGGQAEDQGAQAGGDGGSTRSGWLGGPAVRDQLAVRAQDGGRCDQEPESLVDREQPGRRTPRPRMTWTGSSPEHQPAQQRDHAAHIVRKPRRPARVSP